MIDRQSTISVQVSRVWCVLKVEIIAANQITSQSRFILQFETLDDGAITSTEAT
jgi:hypothetical protein